MEIPKRLWIGNLAGIPFYRNQVLGDAVYTVAIFGGYAILNRLCQSARQVA